MFFFIYRFQISSPLVKEEEDENRNDFSENETSTSPVKQTLGTPFKSNPFQGKKTVFGTPDVELGYNVHWNYSDYKRKEKEPFQNENTLNSATKTPKTPKTPKWVTSEKKKERNDHKMSFWLNKTNTPTPYKATKSLNFTEI